MYGGGGGVLEKKMMSRKLERKEGGAIVTIEMPFLFLLMQEWMRAVVMVMVEMAIAQLSIY